MTSLLKHLHSRIRWHQWLRSTIIVLTAGIVFTFLYNLHNPELNQYGLDVWFQGDIPRVYDNMTDRLAYGHYRTSVHPIYSLLTYPPTFVLKKLLSSDALAIQTVTTCIALLWLIGLYVLLRVLGCVKLDATIFAILGASSSAAMFWLHIPETYALSSFSLILAMSVCLLSQQRKLSDWAFVGANIATMGVTITNWMTALIASFSGLPLKRAVKVTCITILAVILLWGVQKLIFPTSQFFVGSSEESDYIFFPTIERLLAVSHTFFFHSIVAPKMNVIGLNQHAWPTLSFQSSGLGSSGMIGWIGTFIWIVILCLGIWTFFTHRLPTTFKLTLGLTLLGQFVLHSLYGDETFLYALNFVPLLILLAAITTLTPLRKVVITLSLILIPILLVNNLSQLKLASALANPAYSAKHSP